MVIYVLVEKMVGLALAYELLLLRLLLLLVLASDS